MQSFDIEEFIYFNRIKAKDLAKALSVSDGYISNVRTGRKKLSSEQVEKLYSGINGWKVPPTIIEFNAEVIEKKQKEEEEAKELEELRKANAELRILTKKLEQERETFLEIIKNLSVLK